jgi:DDE superfamily endonuclease
VIEETWHMCFLSDTVEGRAHDQNLAELAGYTLPRGRHLSQDRGVQGFILDGVTMMHPKQKPPGCDLTTPEKAHQRVISSIRIRIAHAMGGVKRDRSVTAKIRLWKEGIRDTIMETCCGLHNFSLQDRPWHYPH